MKQKNSRFDSQCFELPDLTESRQNAGLQSSGPAGVYNIVCA